MTNSLEDITRLSELLLGGDFPSSLYVHTPFCVSKCGYCDFNSYSGLEWLTPRYVSALRRELSLWSQYACRPAMMLRIATIYFGGGTPTLLGTGGLKAVLDTCGQGFAVDATTEVTVETNPGVADEIALAELRSAGVNRLSIGIQSFDDGELRFLGRIHTADGARQAWSMARRAGFENLNLDLMYGLPSQLVQSWRDNLEQGLELEPEHISLYALTIEEDTPLGKSIASCRIVEPDPDAAAEMYLLAEERLEQAGYHHYEISNWAIPGRECAHNLTYWRNRHYLGVGAGAHSFLNSYRLSNLKGPLEYVQTLEGEGNGLPVSDIEHVDGKMAMGETMMLGLRLSEGVSAGDFLGRFGRRPEDVYGPGVEDLKRLGLLIWDGDSLRLTARGRLLGNQVFCRFVG